MSIWSGISNFPGFTFIERHERLIIIVVLCIAALWGVTAGLNAWKAHDQSLATALEAQVAADKQQAAITQQQVVATQAAAAADKASSAQTIAAMSAQNASLANAIASRNKQTQTQQTADLHASLPVLMGQRLPVLVPTVNPADIQISPDGKTVAIGADTAQKTIAQLELVPTLQQDLKDAQQENINLTAEIKSLQTYNAALEAETVTEEKEITLLNKQIADADKACQAQIDLEKVKTKAAFLNGFKWGGIVGFIAGLFVGHAI
jgi:hypothetical protein